MPSDLKPATNKSRLGGFHINTFKSSHASMVVPAVGLAPVVTIAELPTPPFSPGLPVNTASALGSVPSSFPFASSSLITPSTEDVPILPTSPAIQESTSATSFHLFPLLPAELRLKIWAFSFLPRTVELHARRTHYANDDHGETPRWRSQSRNPAALSVNTEARAAALEHYTVVLPLAGLPQRGSINVVTGLHTWQRPGDMLRDGDRKLYINVTEDVVVLFSDMNFLRLKRLLDWFRKQDVGRRGQEGGKGLRKLAMSVMAWSIAVGAAATLRAFGRTVFANIEEFFFFIYEDWAPPEAWTGARCELVDVCPDDDYYRRFVMGRGKQFRAADGWMVVGKRPMRVVEIRFHEDGW